jgi:hypothetical protein
VVLLALGAALVSVCDGIAGAESNGRHLAVMGTAGLLRQGLTWRVMQCNWAVPFVLGGALSYALHATQSTAQHSTAQHMQEGML